MVYTNDEADKSARQRKFYLTVYLLPIIVAAVICGAVYMAADAGYLNKGDMMYGYFMSLTPAILLYAFNKRNWLKMPDGTYHNIKGVSPTLKFSTTEPTEYEAAYYYSKTEKAGTVLTGAVMIAASIWLGFKGAKIVLMPVVTNIAGLFLTYTGLKELLDKTAQLKIAKNGLWTRKLGFVNWDDISYADVIEDKSGKSPQTYLEIRLKGTKFEEADQPDERLLLSDLKGKKEIGTVINDSIFKYNEQKNRANFR